MKAIIVDEMHPSLFEMLESHRIDFDYFPNYSKQDYLLVAKGYDILFIRSKFYVDDDVLNQSVNLKIIARAGAGLDNIDVDAANNRGIITIGANEGNRDAVAEQALGMLLNVFHNISHGNKEIENGIWDREGNRGTELKGKKVGIIGFGNNGSEFAKRLQAFDVDIYAYDKYKTDYAPAYVKESNLQEIFDQVDIISFHTPLTEETNGMVNEEFLNRFKKKIFLINVSRGKVVKLIDLIESMKSGKVWGAALDVLENERLERLTKNEQENLDFLCKHPRVILTPHVAGWSFESYQRINEVLITKLIRTLSV